MAKLADALDLGSCALNGVGVQLPPLAVFFLFAEAPLMDRVAGAGLSGAKETPGFRASALQPRPPINPLVTEHYHVFGVEEPDRLLPPVSAAV